MKNREFDAALRRRAQAESFALSPRMESAILRAMECPGVACARRRLGRMLAAAAIVALALCAMPSPCGRAAAGAQRLTTFGVHIRLPSARNVDIIYK